MLTLGALGRNVGLAGLVDAVVELAQVGQIQGKEILEYRGCEIHQIAQTGDDLGEHDQIPIARLYLGGTISCHDHLVAGGGEAHDPCPTQDTIGSHEATGEFKGKFGGGEGGGHRGVGSGEWGVGVRVQGR